MKKRLHAIFFSLFLSVQLIWAAPVPENTARLVAFHFYRIQTGMEPEGVHLTSMRSLDNQPVIYVYQINQSDGFVMVSGDDQAYPVFGYAPKGLYHATEQSPQFSAWMDKYYDELVYIISNNLPQTPEIAEQWQKFSTAETPSEVLRASVGPLVNLGWDQGQYYNADCPFNTQYNQRTVTGCVATAMAMIMRFWSYPAQGSGFHSFNTQQYGTLSANFGSTTFNWNSMPAQLNSANAEVAKLMYQCGVSVEMSYGVSQTGGSAAYVVNAASPIQHCSEYAYKTYFGYDPASVSGVLRAGYSEQQWISLMKAELDAGRPMQYAGIGSGGGHTWVCDGYDNNNFLHMNWGWSNQNDGYFNVNALNPQTLGAGGGSGGFNSNQQAVIGIKPPGGGGGGTPPPPPAASVSIAGAILLNPGNQLDFASPFDVYCQIQNVGNSALTGDFAAVLLTPDGYVVDFIQSFANQSIAASSFVNAQFSTNGLLATPGNYFVAVIYKQGSGNWQLIQTTGGGNNPTPVTILGPYNYLQLYSNMSLSPAQFVSGQAASVTVNLVNDGFFNWYGTYAAALYDLDGQYVTTIGQYTENTGLPPGYVYNPPYLSFSTSNLNVPPGTYILAMVGQEQGFSEYYLLGGTYYTNPITITVQGPPLNPDSFEANNTAAAAYTFNPTLSAGNATVQTTGSNIHLGSDVDFYNINLPPGATYQITPRLHDAYNSGNGNTYTVDGIFSFDAGNGQSPSFDDVINEPIVLVNGGNVLFKVSPYFTGNTGSYHFEVQISSQPLHTTEAQSIALSIYPNPTSELLNVHSSELQQFTRLQIYDALGRLVIEQPVAAGSAYQNISVQELPSGIYQLKAIGHQAVSAQSFIKQ